MRVIYHNNEDKHMTKKWPIKTIFFALLFCAGSTAYASDVTINGQRLTQAEKAALEYMIGTRIMPGNYVTNGNCWMNLTTGASGCLSNRTTNVFSRYGSGERTPQGDWSHWSDPAGGSVGGTSVFIPHLDGQIVN
jgi:hypothetical protein